MSCVAAAADPRPFLQPANRGCGIPCITAVAVVQLLILPVKRGCGIAASVQQLTLGQLNQPIVSVSWPALLQQLTSDNFRQFQELMWRHSFKQPIEGTSWPNTSTRRGLGGDNSFASREGRNTLFARHAVPVRSSCFLYCYRVWIGVDSWRQD